MEGDTAGLEAIGETDCVELGHPVFEAELINENKILIISDVDFKCMFISAMLTGVY